MVGFKKQALTDERNARYSMTEKGNEVFGFGMSENEK